MLYFPHAGMKDKYEFVIVQKDLSHAVAVFNCGPLGFLLGPFLSINYLNDMPSVFLDAIPWFFVEDLKFLFKGWSFEADLVQPAFVEPCKEDASIFAWSKMRSLVWCYISVPQQ